MTLPPLLTRVSGSRLAACALTVAALLLGGGAAAQTAPGAPAESASPAGGPIRLRQPAADPAAMPAQGNQQGSGATSDPSQRQPPGQVIQQVQPAPPGEFEAFVGLPRFGADLVNDLSSGSADVNPVVPPDYIIQSGDEIQVLMWGSVDADLRLVVDRAGRVNINRVGPILVAGTRYADLQATLTRRAALVFRNFELSASMGKLRGVRVYVTGFVQRPGAYAVSGLSTVMNAVMRAGGPAPSGSFRQIELRRDGRRISTFDLYDLLLRGDRRADRLVQPDDVIHVMPVGPQVALRGSVNKQGIFEVKPGETLRDVFEMAAGFSPVADRTRVAIERVSERNGQRLVQMQLPASDDAQLANGDVLRVFSAVDAALSVQRQNKSVRVEGEVASPGEFVLPPNSTLRDALRAAGGITPAAYPYAAQFTRESVRVSQQSNYERALRDLETDMARASTSQRVASAEDAAAANARASATSRLIDRLRALRPNGRVVFQVEPDAKELPDVVLEDGDRLVIPPKPTTVGVFGSVFNAGSYLYLNDRILGDYLRLAGGPTKGADELSTFVVRANGQVVSNRQGSSWYSRGDRLGQLRAEPGDTVFVPEELDKSTFVQIAKDWTQILYQFGIGLAGIKAVFP